MAEYITKCKLMVDDGEVNSVINEMKANINWLDQRLTALETAAADPMAQTSSLIMPKVDEGTLTDSMEKLKEAFHNLNGNIMGISMDSAIEACNNFNKAFNNNYKIQNIIPTTLQKQDVFIIGNEDEIWREGMNWLDDTNQ